MDEKRKPILCLDFDGVIHSYSSGWRGVTVIPDPPVNGAFAAIEDYLKVFDVQVFSSRSCQEGGIDAMKEWFYYHLVGFYGTVPEWAREVKWPNYKPAAFITLDDRGFLFDGVFPHPGTLLSFKPWHYKK